MSRSLVTVKSLLAQARGGGKVEIVDNALITPAAADWLASNGVQVRRARRSEILEDTASRLHMIGDAANARCQVLLPMLERTIGPIEFHPCHGHRDGLLKALHATCAALTECDRRRGVVLVRDGAVVAAIANKHPAVRAAIVTRASQLAMLVRELAVNLLIIEHESVSLQQTRALIEAFAAARGSIEPAVEAALADTAAPVLSECRCQHENR